MRISRRQFYLLVLAGCCLSGCSQTGVFRSNRPSELRTIASVGDKPLPIVAGEPGSSSRTETEGADLRAPTGSRISGRVFDERGQPVAGARVRPVVGGAAGGRVNDATTDRSGAFTLRGLRPGSSYTLVAEYSGEQAELSGRATARAPRSDVRIDVAARAGSSQRGRASIRPARARTDAASDSETETDAVDEGLPGQGRAGSRSVEDSESLGDDRAARDPVTDRTQAARLAAARRSTAPIRAGWTMRQPSQPLAKHDSAEPSPSSASDALTARSASGGEPVVEPDDDGENPLPPALEPDETQRSRSRGRYTTSPLGFSNDPRSPSSARRPDGRIAAARAVPRNPKPDDQAVRADDEAPHPIPDDVLRSSASVSAASFAPPATVPTSGETVGQGNRVPGARRPSSRAPTAAAVPADSQETVQPKDGMDAADPARSEPVPSRRPTWRELSSATSTIPLDEGVRRTSAIAGLGSEPPRPISSATGTRMPETGRFRFLRGSQPKVAPAVGPGTCRFDANERRLIDFQLPGLDGKMVSFRDIDADVIVLDFWGSWCRECSKSTSHLRDLQSRMAGQRLSVIGIACEKGSSFEDRSNSARSAVRRLGIPYPILISSMDGSCQMQQAFQVQVYPTIAVLDKSGRILHTERGATDATLARTDRAIAAALRTASGQVE
jgi:peroxiredoxin